MENVVPSLSRDPRLVLEERPEASTSFAKGTEQVLIQVPLTPTRGLSAHVSDQGKA